MWRGRKRASSYTYSDIPFGLFKDSVGYMPEEGGGLAFSLYQLC